MYMLLYLFAAAAFKNTWFEPSFLFKIGKEDRSEIETVNLAAGIGQLETLVVKKGSDSIGYHVGPVSAIYKTFHVKFRARQ